MCIASVPFSVISASSHSGGVLTCDARRNSWLGLRPPRRSRCAESRSSTSRVVARSPGAISAQQLALELLRHALDAVGELAAFGGDEDRLGAMIVEVLAARDQAGVLEPFERSARPRTCRARARRRGPSAASVRPPARDGSAAARSPRSGRRAACADRRRVAIAARFGRSGRQAFAEAFRGVHAHGRKETGLHVIQI